MLASSPLHTALPVIAPIEPHEIPSTARLLADAFSDNPCYVHMHPRARTRHADMAAFFERNLRWRHHLGLTWVARSAAGEVLGTATLEPPGGVRRPTREMLAHWVVPMLREQGPRSILRLIGIEHAFGEKNALVAGGPAYWHVHAVAIRPDMQGQRVGTRLMHVLLQALQTAREKDEQPAVLSTQRERNLPFYARLGFRVEHVCTIGSSARAPGFTAWFMRQRSRSSAREHEDAQLESPCGLTP